MAELQGQMGQSLGFEAALLEQMKRQLADLKERVKVTEAWIAVHQRLVVSAGVVAAPEQPVRLARQPVIDDVMDDIPSVIPAPIGRQLKENK